MIPSQQQPVTYDYGNLANQPYPSQQQQQQQKLNNGFVYNHSPLSATALLNQQQQAYNNLNLSTRQSAMSGVYPTPRTNLSPSLNFASLYSSRARLSAQKGFEVEDDLEFCPEIQSSYNNHNNFTHHKFNPYTSSTFSPTVSPTTQNALTTSPLPKRDLPENSSPRGITPRAKKVVEIVNPHTGMRVASPNPYK